MITRGSTGNVVTDASVTASVVVVEASDVEGGGVDVAMLGQDHRQPIVAVGAVGAAGGEHDHGEDAEHDDARTCRCRTDRPWFLPPRAGRRLVLGLEQPLVLGRQPAVVVPHGDRDHRRGRSAGPWTGAFSSTSTPSLAPRGRHSTSTAATSVARRGPPAPTRRQIDVVGVALNTGICRSVLAWYSAYGG